MISEQLTDERDDLDDHVGLVGSFDAGFDDPFDGDALEMDDGLGLGLDMDEDELEDDELDEDDLDDDELDDLADEDDLDDDDLDDLDDGDHLDDDLDEDDLDDDDDDDDDDVPAPSDDDDDDDEDIHPSDVEADLEEILRDRIAAGDDDDDDDDDKDATAAPAKNASVAPPRSDEWTCRQCFLIVSVSQFGSRSNPVCPSGEDPCESMERVRGG